MSLAELSGAVKMDKAQVRDQPKSSSPCAMERRFSIMFMFMFMFMAGGFCRE
jgi:ABC-type Na+ efflux pump permease subunit